MDPLTVLNVGLGFISMLYAGAKSSGLIGTPDWLKYADAGLFVAKQTVRIVEEIKSGSAEYDGMTPEQIRARLMPADWTDLEARAAMELGIERALDQ